MPGFQDRDDAGTRLADAVAGLDLSDPVVLALPRGGLPVAVKVAERLGCPLDILLVRKLGVPSQPELAAGAIVDGNPPAMVLNRDVMRAAGLSEEDLEPVRARETEELNRRRDRYRAGRPPLPVEGRDAVVVDDGIATGATARAALKGLRQMAPRSVTLAVPVAPPDTLDRLRGEVDHLVCLEAPAHFMAVGAFYLNFGQVPDEEVTRLMQAEASRRG